MQGRKHKIYRRAYWISLDDEDEEGENAEDSGEEEEGEDEEDLEDEEAEDFERYVEYDSDENEVRNQSSKQKILPKHLLMIFFISIIFSSTKKVEVKLTSKDVKMKAANYFENEAELSGSEASGDEDEDGQNRYEAELGDLDKFDNDKIRSELERMALYA